MYIDSREHGIVHRYVILVCRGTRGSSFSSQSIIIPVLGGQNRTGQQHHITSASQTFATHSRLYNKSMPLHHQGKLVNKYNNICTRQS